MRNPFLPALTALLAALPLAAKKPPPEPPPPPPPDANYLAGLEAFDSGELEAADGALKKFLGAAPPAPAPDRARALYVRARIARQRGQPALAGDLLLQVKSTSPEFAAQRQVDEQWRALAAGLRPIKAPRLNAAQVFILPEDRPLGTYLDELQSAGFDTVLLRVFQAQGDRFHAGLGGKGGAPGPARGVYFRTDGAPVIAPLLEQVAAAGHARGLRVIAWMTSRACDFLPGAAHDEFLDGATGKLKPSRRLDLFDPAVRDRLHHLYLDIMAAGADGLLFQDDLVYRSFEGFSPRGLVALGTLPGSPEAQSLFTSFAPLHYAPAYGGFAAVKTALVSRFIGEASRMIHARFPEALILVNVFYDTVLDANNGRDWLAQDLTADLSAGADYLSVMGYAQQIGEERKLSAAAAAKVAQELGPALHQSLAQYGLGRSRILMKLQTVDWGNGMPLPPDAVLPLYKAAEQEGFSVGLAPAPAGELLKQLRQAASAASDGEE